MDIREFKSLTDGELKFIAINIVNMNEPLEIQRYKDNVWIIGTIDDGTEAIWLDEFNLNSGDFLIRDDIILEYKKYLMSLGINHLLRNNKYI